jgi:hypothetical protein
MGALHAMVAEYRSIGELTMHVNHADLDKHNNYRFNLEWDSADENTTQARIAAETPLQDKRGRKNIFPCKNGNSKLGAKISTDKNARGKLRAGFFMSAARLPESFGTYLTGGCNGAMHGSETYSKFMSDALSAANLPADVDIIQVKNKAGSEYKIIVSNRTIHQILGNLWDVRAIEIIGFESGLFPECNRVLDYVLPAGSFYLCMTNGFDIKVSSLMEDRVPKHMKRKITSSIRNNLGVRLHTADGEVIEIRRVYDVKKSFDLYKRFDRIEFERQEGEFYTVYDKTAILEAAGR